MGFSKRVFVSALLSIFTVPLSGIALADLPVLDLKNSRVAVPSFALQTNNNGALNEIKDENGRMSLGLEEVIYGKVGDETVNGDWCRRVWISNLMSSEIYLLRIHKSVLETLEQ